MSLQERFNYFKKILVPISLPSGCFILSDLHAAAGDHHDPLNGSRTEPIIIELFKEYFGKGYALLKGGDWWDTWRGKDLRKILDTHPNLMEWVQDYKKAARLYEILGNHERDLCSYPEVLIFEGFGKKIFFDHGYFEDWPNDEGWEIGRFAVRAADELGIHPATSPHPVNKNRHLAVIQMRDELAKNNPDWTFIYGHTHNFRHNIIDSGCPVNSFNTGSPITGTVTGYLIEEGNIIPFQRM
jgi:predicted phosphodiesterase